MLRAAINEFGLIIASAGSASAGATITPGNNTYGSYTQLLAGASVTDDVYELWLNFNAVAVSGVARDCLAQVGVDPSGGSSYNVIVPDLLVSCAGAMSGVGLGGIWYRFRLFIKAGSSIAVAMSVNNATVGTGSAFCKLFCKPSHPELIRVGSFVRAFGVTAGSSSGTAITPNAAGSKSTFVQLGSALAETLWDWCLGVGCNNAVMNNNAASWDLAIGSAVGTNRVVVLDQVVIPTTAEVLAYTAANTPALAVAGDLVFARAGGAASSPTGMSAAAYGTGG